MKSFSNKFRTTRVTALLILKALSRKYLEISETNLLRIRRRLIQIHHQFLRKIFPTSVYGLNHKLPHTLAK